MVKLELIKPAIFTDKTGELVDLDLIVRRDEFEDLIREKVNHTIELCWRALGKAELSPAGIDAIIMVGGSSYIPLVQESVEKAFGKKPELFEPDLCVAMGAAVLAAAGTTNVVQGKAVRLRLKAPATWPLDEVTIAGTITPQGKEPLPDCQVSLTYPDGTVANALVEPATGTFSLEDVRLFDGPNPFTLVVKNRAGSELLRHSFEITYAPEATSTDVEIGGTQLTFITKPIYIMRISGPELVVDEGTPLPYSREIEAVINSQSGEVDIPVYEEDQEIGKITISDLPKDLPLGTSVKVSLEFTSDFKVKGTAFIPAVNKRGIANIDLPPLSIPRSTKELEREFKKVSAAYEEAHQIADRNARIKHGPEADKLQKEITEEIKAPSQSPEAVMRKLLRLQSITRHMATTEALKPSKEEFDEQLDMAWSLLRQIDAEYPKVKEYRYDRILDVLKQEGEKAIARNDRMTWAGVNERLAHLIRSLQKLGKKEELPLAPDLSEFWDQFICVYPPPPDEKMARMQELLDLISGFKKALAEWSNSSIDERAYALIMSVSPDPAIDHSEAQQIWEQKERRGADDPLTLHHLAIIHHARAYDLEEKGSDAAFGEWETALLYWALLWNSPSFWQRLGERAQALQAPSAEVERLRELLPRFLLQVHADLVEHYFHQRNVRRAQRHLRLIQNSAFSTELEEEIHYELYVSLTQGAHTHLLQRDFQEAFDQVRRYLEVDPQYARGLQQALDITNEWLAYCYSQENHSFADMQRCLERSSLYAQTLSSQNLTTDALGTETLASFYLWWGVIEQDYHRNLDRTIAALEQSLHYDQATDRSKQVTRPRLREALLEKGTNQLATAFQELYEPTARIRVLEEALRDLDGAAAVDPDWGPTFYCKAQCLTGLERYAEAERDLQTAERIAQERNDRQLFDAVQQLRRSLTQQGMVLRAAELPSGGDKNEFTHVLDNPPSSSLMRFQITREGLVEVYRHVQAAYPEMGCGIILTGGERDLVYPCTNIQNKLHAEDPVRYPSDARTAYTMAPEDMLRILRKAEENGWAIRAFYYSQDYPKSVLSRETRAQALFGDEPAYPETSYLIISLQGGKVVDTAAYKWHESTKDFVQQHVEIRN